MGYVALRFDASAAAADAWGDALLACGALSVDAADAGAGTQEERPLFSEPGEREPRPADWRTTRLTALLPAAADVSGVLDRAASALGVAPPPHETFAVEDADWVRASQAQFAPIDVAPGLWIVPSWCDPVDSSAINIVLDPGLAFGTGSHPTTRLCLRWLAATVRPGDSVLDYGCGSGILAIAAAKLGADRVAGTDVDAQAIVASRANAKRNGVAARFAQPDAPAMRRAGRFDILVANILANPLRLLAPALAARVRNGGRIVLSGILGPQADDVIAAYAPWFRIGLWGDDDGWVALEGARRDARTRRSRVLRRP